MPMVYTKEIKVPVPPENVPAKQKQIAELDIQIRDTLARKALMNAEINQELKDLKKQHNVLLDATQNGFEHVEVQVYDRVNEQLLQVEVVRADTEEVLDELTRPMTADERQLSISSETPPEPKKSRRKRNAQTEEQSAEAPAE